MPMERNDSYYKQLYLIVTPIGPLHYSKLLTALYLTFVDTSTLQKMCPDDINRCMDGIRIRQKYCNDYEHLREYDCSWLELIIGLATRMQGLLDVAGQGDRTSIWFWGMIRDWLGEDYINFSDENTPNLDIINFIDCIRPYIDRLEFRTYLYNGAGGLFCVPSIPVDMRTLSLWYQMQKKVSLIVASDPEYR